MTDTTLGATGGKASYTDMDTPLSTNANQKADAFAGQETADPAAQAKQAARGVAGQVKERLVNTTDGQKAGIADRLDEVADSLQRSSEQFAGKQDWIASAIARGASELGTLASSVRTTDVVDLLGQVQSFARRQPGLFIGASLVAGFALARFGKLVAADVSRDDLPVMPEVGHGQQ